jgi:hypothetical protein
VRSLTENKLSASAPLPWASTKNVDIAHANGVTKLSKHLDIKHKYLQQQVKAGHFRLTQISIADQKADFLTKPLKRTLFTRACVALHLT